MREKLLAHKTAFIIFACAFIVFMGCFSFPIYNFTPDAPESKWYNGAVALFGYAETGMLLGLIYERRSNIKAAGTALVMTGLGMACRYMMEFGEVSNVYNFTLPNIALHFAAALCCIWISALHTENKQ